MTTETRNIWHTIFKVKTTLDFSRVSAWYMWIPNISYWRKQWSTHTRDTRNWLVIDWQGWRGKEWCNRSHSNSLWVTLKSECWSLCLHLSNMIYIDLIADLTLLYHCQVSWICSSQIMLLPIMHRWHKTDSRNILLISKYFISSYAH